VIGGRSLWRFVQYASEYMKLEHFGYLTAVEHPVDSAGQLGGLRLRMAPTLDHLLRCFVEDIRSETNGTRYSLGQEDGQTWFKRDPVIKDNAAGWLAEQYVIMFVVQMVRIYAGQEWLPTRLRISSQLHPVAVPNEWSPIAIEWGQPTTDIHIGAEVLALANPEFVEARDRLSNEIEKFSTPLLHIESLLDRQIWSHEIGIANAAFELGVSETTLKRRLRKNGQSYSALLESRRHYWAKKLLREPHIAIKTIAQTLGYAHTPNFTRAFSRIEGSTPTLFRNQSLSISA
jgi:AraC-like DNA-binding protein